MNITQILFSFTEASKLHQHVQVVWLECNITNLCKERVGGPRNPGRKLVIRRVCSGDKGITKGKEWFHMSE